MHCQVFQRVWKTLLKYSEWLLQAVASKHLTQCMEKNPSLFSLKKSVGCICDEAVSYFAKHYDWSSSSGLVSSGLSTTDWCCWNNIYWHCRVQGWTKSVKWCSFLISPIGKAEKEPGKEQIAQRCPGPEWEGAESCTNSSNKPLIFIFPSFQLLKAPKIILTSSLSEGKETCKTHVGHARNKCRGTNAIFSTRCNFSTYISTKS